MLLFIQSVQYSTPLHTVRPNGKMLAEDNMITLLLPPFRLETSILFSLASAQYRRFAVWSIVNPFGHPRLPVTMVCLDEPSIAAFSILGVDPQSVQYIILFNKNYERKYLSAEIKSNLDKKRSKEINHQSLLYWLDKFTKTRDVVKAPKSSSIQRA